MFQRSARSFVGLALALAAPFGATSNVGAQVLTYGGKSDLSIAMSSYTYSSSGFTNSVAFDNFAIGAGSQWTVTALFGTIYNSGYTPLVTALNWEIRQGMVAGGSTGTVVHAGSGTFSQSASVYTIAATPFTLNAGTYWLGIWADLSGTTLTDPNGFRSFGVDLTTGANSVNALSDAQSIWLTGADGANAGGTAERIDRDLSYGVLGRTSTVTTVPEPGSILLTGGGLLALGFVARRRRQING